MAKKNEEQTDTHDVNGVGEPTIYADAAMEQQKNTALMRAKVPLLFKGTVAVNAGGLVSATTVERNGWGQDVTPA